MDMKFLILISLLALEACGAGTPAAVTYHYVPIPTPGGSLCTTQCSEAKDYCGESCTLKYRQCVVDVQAQALHDYDHYTVEQFINHQPIELRVSDFERMNTCDGMKKECEDGCENHFRSCYTDCGGEVVEKTSCQYFCY
jgi:hypothetical protein